MVSRLSSIALKSLTVYNVYLESHPLPTKCVTSGVMYGGGDLIAQYLEHFGSNDPLKKDFSVSWRRVVVFFAFGNIIAGPSYHYWFNYLNEVPVLLWSLKQSRQRGRILRAYALLKSYGIEVKLDMEKIPKASKIGKWTSKCVKIALDQLVFASVYTGVFFMGIGMLSEVLDSILDGTPKSKQEAYSGCSSQIELDKLSNSSSSQYSTTLASKSSTLSWLEIWKSSLQHTKEVYWDTYLTDCLVWPPLQVINFTFVPLRFQFLYVNCANLLWNAFLSVMAHKTSSSPSMPSKNKV